MNGPVCIFHCLDQVTHNAVLFLEREVTKQRRLRGPCFFTFEQHYTTTDCFMFPAMVCLSMMHFNNK